MGWSNRITHTKNQLGVLLTTYVHGMFGGHAMDREEVGLDGWEMYLQVVVMFTGTGVCRSVPTVLTMPNFVRFQKS
jgi:hypothetical protein